MKRNFQSVSKIALMVLAFFVAGGTTLYAQKNSKAPREKTAFQEAAPWDARYDIRSDVAIVYGTSDDFEQRVQVWRDRGYQIHFMTGIAWGNYQDYFLGRWDGINHLDEGQVILRGDTLWHGRYVPYLVPTKTFIKYMKEEIVKRAIDAGATAIHLEEPEFWARAGYSDAFKREWQMYYNEPWRPQHESAENTYLSAKLKYHLYYEALKEVFTYAKEYSKQKGYEVRCYVPTHSLVNYSLWQIVSPEASLAMLDCVDGYIAQVWTGTSREPIFYNGIEKERVFENAFLEYGSMVSMTAPTKRKMFFLTDPIEDNGGHTWEDYRYNYQATFAAKLLYPMVDNYEVMPWPRRIYLGKYRTEGSSERSGIPQTYATQMQVMINALNDMPLSKNKLNGSQGIGVLLGNSMMFQRAPAPVQGYDDPKLSNFYGMAIPLLKRGIPVETVHMENVSVPATLKDLKVLVMTYSSMKPMSPEVNIHIADWVKKGGVLVYYGDDKDPFQTVREWWNTNGNTYKSPSEHLFKQMGITGVAAEGSSNYSYGKGKVYVVRTDPKHLILNANADKDFVTAITQAYETDAKAGKLEFKNNLYLERGPYTIAAVLDESVSAEPLVLNGPLIDLYDPELPVLASKKVAPREQAFVYVPGRVKEKAPKVLCGAARVYDEKSSKGTYSFVVKSPAETWNVMRILLPSEPTSYKVEPNGKVGSNKVETSWDAVTKTYLMKFENHNDGVKVELKW